MYIELRVHAQSLSNIMSLDGAKRSGTGGDGPQSDAFSVKGISTNQQRLADLEKDKSRMESVEIATADIGSNDVFSVLFQ